MTIKEYIIMYVPDGRDMLREAIRGLHIYFDSKGISRDTVFTACYAFHLIAPLIAIYFFLTRPWTRPIVYGVMIFAILVQIYFRTCPMAKIEWHMIPNAEKITWRGADSFGKYVCVIDNKTRFKWMVISTFCSLSFLFMLSRVYPEGILPEK